MPRATCRYGFERKALAFAQIFADRFAAPALNGAFLLTLDGAGGAASLTFAEPPGGWRAQTQALEAAGVPYFFYDPFDAPEYTWVSWSGISRAVMERMMALSFAPGDFLLLDHRAQPDAANGPPPPPAEFPATWGVMF